MVDTNKTTRLRFVVEMARARFDFDRQNPIGIERERAATPHETLQRLRAVATLTATPPAPLATRLVEEVVHGEDIRRPLGIARRYQQEAVLRSLRLLARTPASFGGAKELVARVRLIATDTDFTAGFGPEVRGPALALLLAISGRWAADHQLDGPGLPAMRQ
jgi:uncharacterized protein (TIGR03083 family)